MGRKKKVVDDMTNDMVGGTCCDDGSQNEDELVASSVPGSDVPKKKRRGPVNKKRGRPRRVKDVEASDDVSAVETHDDEVIEA
jgi:hypothetical protein